MSRTKFRFKLAGLNTLMRSGEMQSILTAAAKQIAAAHKLRLGAQIGHIPVDGDGELCRKVVDYELLDVHSFTLSAVLLTEISRCALDTDYNYPDLATKRPRYQALFEIVHDP